MNSEDQDLFEMALENGDLLPCGGCGNWNQADEWPCPVCGCNEPDEQYRAILDNRYGL